VTVKLTENMVVAEFTRIHDGFSTLFPHLAGVLGDETSFNGLRLNVRDDGTVLAILKRFDQSGGPIVCFGVGYGAVGALHGLDRTVASGSWKVDKPWEPKSG
jgi:hypothetical protein